MTGFFIFNICEYFPLCYGVGIVDYTNTVYFDQYGDIYAINENTFIADGVYINTNKLEITESLWLENAGVINSDIYLDNNCDLVLVNSGVVNGDFILGDSATITHLVTSAETAVPLDIGASYDLKIDGVDGLNLAGLIYDDNLARVIVSNSRVLIGKAGVDNLAVYGDVILELGTGAIVYDVPIITNVVGDGRVVVSVDSDNPLYAIKSYFVDDDVYLKRVRETDYAKILKNDVGKYLNLLRLQNPNDKLLMALDNANDMRQINEIMADSMRIEPFNMMQYVRVYNMYTAYDFMAGTGVGARLVSGNRFNIYGAGVHGGFNVNNVAVWGALNTAYLDVNARYENFGADLYSGNFGVAYETDSIFVRSGFGITLSRFDLENVIDGNLVVDSPVGWSGIMNVQAGYKFAYNDFMLKPYVGIYADGISLLDETNFDFMPLVGIDAGYNYEMLGIEYNYGMRLDINTYANIGVGVWAEFLSPWDEIGGRISIMTIDDNKTGRSFEFCADVKFVF